MDSLQSLSPLQRRLQELALKNDLLVLAAAFLTRIPFPRSSIVPYFIPNRTNVFCNIRNSPSVWFEK